MATSSFYNQVLALAQNFCKETDRHPCDDVAHMIEIHRIAQLLKVDFQLSTAGDRLLTFVCLTCRIYYSSSQDGNDESGKCAMTMFLINNMNYEHWLTSVVHDLIRLARREAENRLGIAIAPIVQPDGSQLTGLKYHQTLFEREIVVIDPSSSPREEDGHPDDEEGATIISRSELTSIRQILSEADKLATMGTDASGLKAYIEHIETISYWLPPSDRNGIVMSHYFTNLYFGQLEAHFYSPAGLAMARERYPATLALAETLLL